MAKNPQKVAEKWARNLSGATQDIRDGVTAVTESPTEKAAAQAEKYRLNTAAAVDSGKFQARLRGVTLDDWKRATLDKGIARIASGAAAATDDVAGFMGELIPYQERVKEEMKNMPNTTLADSIARQSFWTTKMADFQRSG